MEINFGILYCILVVAMFIAMLILIGSISISVIYRLKKISISIGVLFLAGTFIHFQLLTHRNFDEIIFADYILTAAELIASIICFALIFRASNKRINAYSVKQALDTLGSGICYYKESGMVKLVNTRMDEISEILCGESVRNGNQFYDLLTKKSAEFGNTGQSLFETDDKKVFWFVRNEMMLQNEKAFELIVTDITEEYLRSKELEVKQKEAEKVSDSFRDLAKQAQTAAMEREVLQARINLHDELGKISLLAKKYLESGSLENLTEKDLVREWINTLEAIKRDVSEGYEYDFDKARRTAQLLGAALEADEIFAEDKQKRSVVSQALICALNNAVRHGKADKVWMSAQDEKDGKKLIVIDNNGLPARQDSTEKGGLKSLRKNVEALGGDMKVMWEKNAELRITI